MSNEELLNQPTGISQDDYESAPRPPLPVDETGRRIAFDFMRFDDPENPISEHNPKSFGFSKNGDIYFKVTHIFSGGEYDQSRINDLMGTWKAFNREATAVDDFLRASGTRVEAANGIKPTNLEYLRAVAQTTGPFQAFIDWEGYCPGCEETRFKKLKDFPLREDGETREHDTECTECGERVVARAKIQQYIVPK